MTILNIIIAITAFLMALGTVIVIRTFQIPSQIRRANELFEQDLDTQANDIVKRVLAKKPDYTPARYLRAKILTKQTQYLSAIYELNSIQNLPEYQKHVPELEIHLRLADLYNLTLQGAKEIDEYKIILTLNPDDVNANHRVGLTYFRQKKYFEAYDHLIKTYALSPLLVDIYMPIGVSSYQLSKFDEAEEFLLKACSSNQSNDEAQFYLGLIYKGKKDYDNAIKMFQNSKRESRFTLTSLKSIAEIYYQNEDIPHTIATLEEGLKSLKPRDDESIEYRYLLAEAYEVENKITEAVYHWEKIEAESPNYKNTAIKLADYRNILSDNNFKNIFTSPLDQLQSMIAELIARLNFNILSKSVIPPNKIYYKAFNVKRLNEPPILIHFNRSAKDIDEASVGELAKKIAEEQCKGGIYIATAKFTPKAKTKAASKSIEMFDRDYLVSTIPRINR